MRNLTTLSLKKGHEYSRESSMLEDIHVVRTNEQTAAYCRYQCIVIISTRNPCMISVLTFMQGERALFLFASKALRLTSFSTNGG